MVDFSRFHLSDSAHIVSPKIPGKKSEELLQKQYEIEGSVVSYPRNIPIAIKQAKGAIVEDMDEKQLFKNFIYLVPARWNIDYCKALPC